MRKFIGASLVATPFCSIFFWAATQSGVMDALLIFAIAFGIVGCIALGVYFLTSKEAA
jgi:hypothetical protein